MSNMITVRVSDFTTLPGARYKKMVTVLLSSFLMSALRDTSRIKNLFSLILITLGDTHLHFYQSLRWKYHDNASKTS